MKYSMKKNHGVISLIYIFLCIPLYADPIISFFFKPLNDLSKLTESLKKPGKLAKYTVRGIVQSAPVSGILATYGGYIATSNYNGAMVFPRKHQKSIVTFVITPEIIPVSLFENTITHWTLTSGLPAQMYTAELLYNDDTRQYYWDMKEAPLPEDNIIPLSAIVIMAKPKNIVMSLGKTSTSDTANLVLPDIYVKKGIDITKHGIYMLTIRHLFKTVNIQEMPEQLKILTHIID